MTDMRMLVDAMAIVLPRRVSLAQGMEKWFNQQHSVALRQNAESRLSNLSRPTFDGTTKRARQFHCSPLAPIFPHTYLH